MTHRYLKGPTVADAKRILRERGISVNKRDGEYRVNFLGGEEATAYYTDDIEDAIRTGLAMATSRDLAFGLAGAKVRPRLVN